MNIYPAGKMPPRSAAKNEKIPFRKRSPNNVATVPRMASKPNMRFSYKRVAGFSEKPGLEGPNASPPIGLTHPAP